MLLILVLISLLDHIFIPKYINENTDGRITAEFYEERPGLDLVALGSSTLYNAMIPAELYKEKGICSFVRSNASQTVWQSYYLLEDAIKYNKPKIVIFDVSFMKYGEDFVEEPSNRKTIEHMKSPVSKYCAVKASMYEEEDIASYYFPILRYHSRWKELTTEDIGYAYASPQVTYNGYIMESQIAKDQHIYESEAAPGISFPAKAMEYLDRITELCRKEDIKLLLIKTPTFVNSWHREYDDLLREYAAENSISYFNFDDMAEAMNINVRTDYIDDGEHLNINGAKKFTTALGDYLLENCELEDHRGDEGLNRSWQEKLDRYEADSQRAMEEFDQNRQEMGL